MAKSLVHDDNATAVQAWFDQHPFGFFIIFFPTLRLIVSITLSYIGGWAWLAQQFRTHSKFVGSRWSGQSAWMRWIASYGNCLTTGANPEGFYLAIMLPFRLGHPPLFVPWNEVSVRRTRLWILGEYVRLGLGRELDIPLWIDSKLAARLKDASEGQWPIESL